MRVVALFAAAAAILVCAGGAMAGAELWVSSDLTLTADHDGPIGIVADGITLDCAGHSILGGGPWAVSMNGRSGVTVKNCHVGPGFGVAFSLPEASHNTLTGNSATEDGEGFALAVGANDNVLIDNTATRSHGTGFTINNSSGNTLRGNRSIDNEGHGFAEWVHAHDNVYDGNTASGNATGGGFSLTGDGGSKLTGNVSSGSGYSGYYVAGDSSNTTIVGNESRGDANGGYYVETNANTLTGNVATGSTRGSGFTFNGSDSIVTDNTSNDNADQGFFLGQPAHDNTLRGNTANDNHSGGFFVTGTRNTIADNTAERNYWNAINVWGPTTTVNVVTGNTVGDSVYDGIVVSNGAHDNNIAGNTAHDNGGTGFSLQQAGPRNWIGGNVARDNRGEGFRVEAASNTIDDNTAIGNYWNGIHVWGADSSGNTISGNRISTTVYTGILVSDGAHDNVVTGNTARDNGNQGLSLWEAGPGNALRSNTAIANGMSGLFVGRTSYAVLDGNTATDGAEGLIIGNGAGHITVTGNTAERNTRNGFALYTAESGNVLRANTAEDNGQNGVQVYDTPDVVLTNNVVRRHGNAGFDLDRVSHATVTGNTASGSYWFGIHLALVTAGTVSGNTSTANTYDGITLDGSTGVLVEGNTTADNGSNGYMIRGSSSNVIRKNSSTNNNFGYWVEDGTGNRLEDNQDRDSAIGFSAFIGADATTLLRNRATGDSRYGYLVRGNHGTSLTRNTATKARRWGFILFEASQTTLTENLADSIGGDAGAGSCFLLASSNDNVLLRNVATRCALDGFGLDAANRNKLSANSALGNRAVGFHASADDGGSVGNTFSLNIGRLNGQWDALDENPRRSNTWTANSFGRSRIH